MKLRMAMAGLLLMAAPAVAQVAETRQSGAWTNLEGVADSGQPMCGMSINGDGRIFVVKYFAGDENLFIHMGRVGWSLRPGASVKVRLTFGSATPWAATASAIGDGRLVQFQVPNSMVPVFEREFRASARFTVEFPGTREEGWAGSMVGSDGAASEFVRCIERIGARMLDPFRAPGGSRPSAAPAPARPGLRT